MTYEQWTRRQAIQRAGALAVGAGLGTSLGTSRLAGNARPHPPGPGKPPAAELTSGQEFWTFVSRPDLQPPKLTITNYDLSQRCQSGYLFIAPHGLPAVNGGGGIPGRMIMDWDGQVVYYNQPAPLQTDDFMVQYYQGKPVLTYWEGTYTLVGSVFFTTGVFRIADSSYTPVATISAVGNGFSADNHEILITSQDTGYITTRQITTADLTSIGGPVDGQVLDSAIQEIDIATGDLLFQWDALQNVPVSETYLPYSAGGPMDLYHCNSIDLAPDGNLIVSARDTWTIYKISRSTGRIMWRLGGKNSDFSFGPGASFAWQHDARMHAGGNILSLFDNESGPPANGPQSRGIFIALDTGPMRASLLKQYTHPGTVLAANQGNVQLVDGRRLVIQWGNEPYLSVLSLDGELLWDAQYPVPGGPLNEVYQSYRGLNFEWTGLPADTPAAAALAGTAGGAVVYASWNGATEIARWAVLAGPAASSLSPAGWARRTGFETGIPVSDPGPCYVAVALDAFGRELGRSNPVTVGTGSQ